MTDIEAILLIIVLTSFVVSWLSVLASMKARKKIHPALQATVNKAYSKAQQALENSVEAIQIATDTVPEKPNKPCNSKFETGGGVYRLCTLPKYPGHEDHGFA